MYVSIPLLRPIILIFKFAFHEVRHGQQIQQHVEYNESDGKSNGRGHVNVLLWRSSSQPFEQIFGGLWARDRSTFGAIHRTRQEYGAMQKCRCISCVRWFGIFLQPRLQAFERTHRSTGKSETYAEYVADNDRNVHLGFDEQQRRDAQLFGQNIATPEGDK